MPEPRERFFSSKLLFEFEFVVLIISYEQEPASERHGHGIDQE